MDGLPVREYEGKPLHVTPGLCLFYVNPEKKLMPIAIQVFSWKWENSQIWGWNMDLNLVVDGMASEWILYIYVII